MKTLILFSTRDGQTREIASYLASELKEQGIDADTIDLNRTNGKRRYTARISGIYDKDGNPVQTPFTDRTIAVPLDTLRNLPYCIGMAASREKVPAIMGALHGHLINVLITDESTATILLHE